MNASSLRFSRGNIPKGITNLLGITLWTLTFIAAFLADLPREMALPVLFVFSVVSVFYIFSTASEWSQRSRSFSKILLTLLIVAMCVLLAGCETLTKDERCAIRTATLAAAEQAIISGQCDTAEPGTARANRCAGYRAEAQVSRARLAMLGCGVAQ